jgi:hypothetical protein
LTRLLQAGVTYFLLVYASGAGLGLVRELLVAPRLGPLPALLVEAPFMIVAILGAARWVIRRHAIPRDANARLVIGLIGLALLIPAEIAGAISVRGFSMEAYLASLITPAGLASFALFLLFAAGPVIETRIDTGRTGS